ncbi:ChbG/HpnK family deacetylase [Paenibacillus lycopersici]|uniref:ChbG/HpnK family deacetylase n=1 Tax=Paenibacillus lycopersici TaxID=2704462 RepID=A0A6C0G6X3_9BACL|nr:polysaccharide deacetylase family protein [Paenibacillus lycopersici]QHT62135.1 ChbG/HpnK family deacetylase [Paenibacillus lycopersici]
MIRKMGYTASDRLLIIHADDFGITQGTNEAIVNLFEEQSITSASIMIPCPDSAEAMELSKRSGITNIGIHLTLTSDESNPYTPVCATRKLTSLITAEGCFHADVSFFERNADEQEVLLEMEAQIQKAISQGIDPTHLDSHAGSVMGLFAGRDFLEPAFDLCGKYRLPFLLPARAAEQPFFNPAQQAMFQNRIASANERGILLIDDIVSLPYCCTPVVAYGKMKQQLAEIIKNTKPGITQLTLHPARITDRLRTITSCYSERELEYRLLNDPDMQQLIDRERITLISWKDLRDLQRSM